jgi:hypothetical protein
MNNRMKLMTESQSIAADLMSNDLNKRAGDPAMDWLLKLMSVVSDLAASRSYSARRACYAPSRRRHAAIPLEETANLSREFCSIGLLETV